MGARRSRALGRPALHVLLGTAAAAAFIWPLLTADGPLQAVEHLFGAWAVAIAALFVLSRAPEEEGDEHGGGPGV